MPSPNRPLHRACVPADPGAPVARRAWIPAAAALIALGACLPAAAQTSRSPFYTGGSIGLGYDTNVLRTVQSAAQSDTYLQAGVLAGFDQSISRQRVFGDVSLRTTRYTELSQLSGQGYGINLGLDWSTVGRLSGTLRASANQNQARLTDPALPTITTRNEERTQQLQAVGRWGLAQLFELEATGVVDRLAYSNDLATSQNLDQEALGLAVRYSPSALLTLGVGGRSTDGRYPKFYAVAPGVGSPLDFKRRDIDFTALWVPTGLTRVDARISSTQVDYDQDPRRDVSGVTGALTLAYRPTGRIGLNATVFRDTGAAATFLQQGIAAAAQADTSQLSTGLSLAATYDLTGKIQATGSFNSSTRNYDGSLSGQEDIRNYGLGLRWEATRTLSVNCSLVRENRDSSTPASFSYSFTSTLCTARMVLR